MSVLDWLRKLLEPAPPPKPARAPRAGSSRPRPSSSRSGKRPDSPSASRGKAASARPAPWQPRALPDDARWIGPNEQLEFQGLAIRGGLVYIGQRLAAGYAGNDPSLIDPSLPVAFPSSASPDPDLPAWATYATLQPNQRGAYLRWLAGGRRDANVPVAYPFLYLYGIERRVLLEHASAQDRGEMPAIRAELGALLATYGGIHEGFRVATERMIGLIDLQQVDRALVERARHGDATMPFSAATLPPPPPLMPANDVPPISLQIGLGLQALARAPIDPAWALAWAWYAPAVAIRTPALRCQAELAALFAIRYREHYGDGIVLDPGGFERLVLQIQPANALLNVQTVRAQLLPDVLARSWFYRPLTTMIAGLTAELDAYSRWLGRNPDRAGSLSAWAMLPEVLARPDAATVSPDAGRLAALIGAGPVAVVETDALLRVWVGERTPLPDRITRADATLLATALDRLGYGVEPDPRTGTALTRGETVAIFRLPAAGDTDGDEGDASRTPESPFGQAMTLVHLAAIVGEADGAASGTEFAAMRDHLRTRYPLTTTEERRLGARLAWLASRPAAERTLAGMKKAIAPLSPVDRDRLAEGLLRIVDADGTVTPDEVTVLQKIWRLLGRDPDRVASDLHAVMTGGHLNPSPTTPAPSGQRARRA
ncbi:MAG: TerB N-terminal domain-containing protein, partial [Thermomicrobiales bacterium]